MQNQPAAPDTHESAPQTGRVLPFRRPGRPPAKPFTIVDTAPRSAPSTDDSFARYEADRDEPISDRQRMLMNLIAIAVVVFLISLGVWIADTIQISTAREDCALQGRTNCEPIVAPAQR
ncbi:MAG TPA: hypothetical protein VMA30_02880 [Xanthobacteraceae bacterium]|nr:hypothetical protein [Xanthobacteraceae bacterium]